MSQNIARKVETVWENGQAENSLISINPVVSKRILIVEDEPEILSAYEEILKRQPKVVPIRSSRSRSPQIETSHTQGESLGDGFEVTAVSNGEEALEAVKKAIAEKKPFALGFFDVLLGEGIDGIETVIKIATLIQFKPYSEKNIRIVGII
jgi:CheY-like chemotaxis protein